MNYQQEADLKSNSKHISHTLHRVVVSVFIFFYILIALVQSVPTASLPKSVAAVSEPLISLTGTKQRWNLFAPELMHVNQYSTVLIINKDGNMQLYEWPRLDLKNALEKFYLQQTRRFVTECLARPQFRCYWPGISERFIKRFSDPNSPVAQVNLRFNFNNVPFFDRYATRENLPRAYKADTTFAYFKGQKK